MPHGLRRPADYLRRFPDGRVPVTAPVGVAEVAAVARGIRSELERRAESVSGLARRAEVDRTTIHALLAGRAYIDVVTLARLERALGVALWPRPE